MAHPVRLRILSLLTGAALTAAEVARELGLTHANASYHLRQLLPPARSRSAGEERIRGGIGQAVPLRHRSRAGPQRTAGRPAPSTSRHRRLLYDALAAELRRRASHVRPTRRVAGTSRTPSSGSTRRAGTP